MIRSMVQLSLSIMILLSLLGCKKEDPNPELKDPIYSDLSRRHAEAQKSVDEASARIPELKLELDKAEPRSIDLKNLQNEMMKERARLAHASLAARYYRIRAERRRLEGRIAYRKAFFEGKEWPDPSEYSDYQLNIRLREANRNWAARVPKLQDRMPSSKPPPKEQAAESSGGH